MVDVEHGRADPVLADLGLGQVEPDERLRVDRRAELVERHAEREVRRRRREEVAAVEGPRDRVERVLGVRELVRLVDPAERVGRRQEQPVVGPDEQPAVAGPQRERPAMAADAGIDDGEMDAVRHVRERVAEHERRPAAPAAAGSRG